MDGREVAAARLNELRYLEQQETRIADAAIERAGDAPLSLELRRIRDDHARHEQQLADLLGDVGGEQADPSHEFMAFVQAQLRLVIESASRDDLLERLLLAERGSAASYAEVATEELPPAVASRLRAHRIDEMRHVSAIERLAPPSPDMRHDPDVDEGGPRYTGRMVTTPGTGVGHGPWSDPEGPHGQRDPDLIDIEPDEDM